MTTKILLGVIAACVVFVSFVWYSDRQDKIEAEKQQRVQCQVNRIAGVYDSKCYG